MTDSFLHLLLLCTIFLSAPVFLHDVLVLFLFVAAPASFALYSFLVKLYYLSNRIYRLASKKISCINVNYNVRICINVQIVIAGSFI